MQHNPAIPFFILCCLLHGALGAQSVSYSSTVNDDANTSFEAIGKAGDFYWLYKTKKSYSYKNGRITWPPKEDYSFEVYDARLQHEKEIPASLPDSVLKQYLVPQKHCFDQVLFKQSFNKTSVIVNRFAQDGAGAVKSAHLFDFPGQMVLEDILLTRSQDRTKILLVGFVRSGGVSPDLYARVYTQNWELMHETVYKEGNLVQPFIQYNFTEYALESSQASPIKVTNNGNWLMVAPARFRNNYALCHFKSEDSSFVLLDVQQPKTANVEYCNLSVEEGKDAYIAVLENLTATDKRVRIVQYNLPDNRLGHDTTYSFYLPDGFKKQEQYVSQEEFVYIPGKGFMYMKEYGRSYYIDHWGEQVMLDNEQEYAAYSTRAKKLKFNEREYTRNSDLSERNKRFERGDLSMKYFPFHPADTSWGGLLHVEQATELRYDNLSYACVPSRDKIIFLYNSLAKNEYKVSSTTVLDHKGQPIDEGVIFWRSTNVLDFQKARLIDPGELYVPFDRNGFQGFAIIRF
jgi:hypothetical protein